MPDALAQEDEINLMAQTLGGQRRSGKVERITMKPVSPIADFSYDYQDLLFTPTEKAK